MPLQSWGPWAQATATIVAAIVAWRGITAWRRQQVSLKRQDVAEKALLAAFEVVQAFKQIRSPLILAHEMVDDKGEFDKTWRGERNAYSRRWDIVKPAFEKLRESVLLVEMHFGKQTSEPIVQFFSLIRELDVAIDMKCHPHAEGYEQEFKEKLQRTVAAYNSRERKDEFGEKADELLQQAKARLRRYLLMPGERDPDDQLTSHSWWNLWRKYKSKWWGDR